MFGESSNTVMEPKLPMSFLFLLFFFPLFLGISFASSFHLGKGFSLQEKEFMSKEVRTNYENLGNLDSFLQRFL